MQQLLKVWTQLDLRRQVVVVLATVAVFFGIIAMSRMASAPSMTLLYAGLENGAAGDVVRALEQRGVSYDVRGGSIFVDSAQRDELRLTLASEGLPANGNRGYELLDNLNGFGTTSQMFDAAYWRAKEGELARTIVANPQISMARVHIATSGSNPFQRGITPKASVSLTTTGTGVSAAQAKAVRFLVASAVAGLSPDDVAVIDADGSLVGATEDSAPAVGGDDISQVLRERVQRLLEARVGFGNAVVEVSVDTVTESEAIRERTFDPEGRVAISTDTEERNNTSQDSGGGEVTVASNLPDQDGAGASDSSSSQNSETRERVNYEVSETEREIVRAPGAIRRVTVAVLVNEPTTTDPNGATVPVPRTEEELTALRELVSSAVGFDETRGDIITIKSMALLSVPPSGTSVENSLFSGFAIDVMSAVQLAVLALVTLVLGLFVIRPILSPKELTSAPIVPALQPADLASSETDLPALDGEISHGDLDLPALEMNDTLENDIPPLENLPMMGGLSPEDPVERLRTMIGERKDETVEILRGWLEDTEEKA